MIESIKLSFSCIYFLIPSCDYYQQKNMKNFILNSQKRVRIRERTIRVRRKRHPRNKKRQRKQKRRSQHLRHLKKKRTHLPVCPLPRWFLMSGRKFIETVILKRLLFLGFGAILIRKVYRHSFFDFIKQCLIFLYHIVCSGFPHLLFVSMALCAIHAWRHM